MPEYMQLISICIAVFGLAALVFKTMISQIGKVFDAVRDNHKEIKTDCAAIQASVDAVNKKIDDEIKAANKEIEAIKRQCAVNTATCPAKKEQQKKSRIA